MKQGLSGSMANELEVWERSHKERQRAIARLDELKEKEKNSDRTTWKENGCRFTKCKVNGRGTN